MIWSVLIQVRGYRAKYMVWMDERVEADSKELAIVLAWDRVLKLKSVKGPHEVLAFGQVTTLLES